ncbi:MAG: hypothetical protein RR370_03215 [Synergistaceae bacterium]
MKRAEIGQELELLQDITLTRAISGEEFMVPAGTKYTIKSKAKKGAVVIINGYSAEVVFEDIDVHGVDYDAINDRITDRIIKVICDVTGFDKEDAEESLMEYIKEIIDKEITTYL